MREGLSDDAVTVAAHHLLNRAAALQGSLSLARRDDIDLTAVEELLCAAERQAALLVDDLRLLVAGHTHLVPHRAGDAA